MRKKPVEQPHENKIIKLYSTSIGSFEVLVSCSVCSVTEAVFWKSFYTYRVINILEKKIFVSCSKE